jgi:hypothetical protein
MALGLQGYAEVLVRLSHSTFLERGLAISLPVILPRLPLDALGRVSHSAEAGHYRPLRRAQEEDLRGRAVQEVAAWEGLLIL